MPGGITGIGRVGRRLYNILGQATGLGLTANIADCYAFLIRHWQPGDRIFLFGFSRGAYTVRCVGGVLAPRRARAAEPGRWRHRRTRLRIDAPWRLLRA